MKKAEFVDKFVENVNKKLEGKYELNKKQTTEIVDEFWDIILKTIKKGDEVVFHYGKFILKKKPAREARNPMTGATVKVPAKIVPQFKPNKKFKEEVVA